VIRVADTFVKINEDQATEYASSLEAVVSIFDKAIAAADTAVIDDSNWVGPTKQKYSETLSEMKTKLEGAKTEVEEIKASLDAVVRIYDKNLTEEANKTFADVYSSLLDKTQSVVGNWGG
jgi:hypothetical protein